MNDVMMALAFRLHQKAMESAADMAELSKAQEGYAAQRKKLREFKQKVRDKMRSGDTLDQRELTELIDEGARLGLDTSALQSLKDQGGDARLKPEDPGDDDQSAAAAKNEEAANEFLTAIDDLKSEIGDQDDQLSFKLQVMFNKYSTAIGQASSTVQNMRQNNQTLNQKLA